MPSTTSAHPQAVDLSLTVIVCAYTMDRWDDLKAALGSLRDQDRPVDEVILVVDHCQPLADRATAELPGAARIVASRGPRGLSGARNTGIAEARGEILAFLDDDAAADPQWSARLLAGYGDRRVLGVGGLIRPRWDHDRPAWFPAEFDWVIGCTYRGMPRGLAPVRNLLGANMSFRREVLAQCGGFRTDLGRVGTRPLGCEETELCIRASQQNPDGVLLYDPAAAVRHHVPDKRATWAYFRARCYAEGLSKAAVARRTGARRALATERSYLRSTIPGAIGDALKGAWRRDAGRPSPATVPAVAAGVAFTAAGYAAGRLRSRRTTTAPEPRPAAPARLPDLYATVPELQQRLTEAGERGDVLDAYLAACGIDQVLEDRLRGTSSLTRRTATHLGLADRGTPGRIALRSLDLATRGPAHRTLEAWHKKVKALTATLADAVQAGRAAQVTLTAIPGRALPLLADRVMRPPACFRSFDQHPRDVRELITRFATRYPDRALPLLVLGVRTSGTYLAPLAAASARAQGYRSVTVRTIRPGERLRVQRANGLVLVIDDPPSSGRSLAKVAREAERAGFPRDRVVIAFAAFGDGTVPEALADRPCVVLPGTDWDIRRRLSAEALSRMVTAVLHADPPAIPSRLGHLAVPLTVRTTDGSDVPMIAEGTGLGYFGRHAAAVAAALPAMVPRVLGFSDGVLLRERARDQHPAAASPETIADYVTTRQRALRLPADRSLLIDGQEPVWEIGARILSRTLGRLGTPLRPLLIDPILRELLRAESPCVVDGRMLPWLWSSDGKTGFDDGCFSHLDLASADAVYDLAGAALFAPTTEDRLIARYEEATGERITPARWCVYKLVHAWNVQRLQRTGLGAELADLDPIRAQDQAVQQFLGTMFLGDLNDEPEGPWCVLDIDGVLESDLLGFPMSSPAGALALRALRAHGYRVLLATGRSLPEVRDRCAAYRLPGGVAEYGAVIYDAASDESTPLPPEHDGTLAATIRALPSTDIDPRYRHCVRAFHRSSHGNRTALDPGTVHDLVTQHPTYTPVPGDAQTDFLPAGLDKLQGIRALTGLLDDADVPLALAVGDTHTDVAMLCAARLGLAPGNARRPAMRAGGIEVLTRSYQAGLAQAVERLLGHRAGACPACRAPEPPAAERALLALLAIPEAGRRGAATRLLRLARTRPAASRQGGRSR